MEPVSHPPTEPGPAPLRMAVVTGAAGFLGGVAVRRLLAMPSVEQVVGVDTRPPGAAPADPRLRAEVRDLRRPLADLLQGADAVLHFAFRLRPSRSEADDRSVNVAATADLLEACAAVGVSHFVYPSSTTVYGAGPGPAGPHPEGDPLRPVPGFRYAEHKAEAEALTGRFAAAHPSLVVTILRASVVLAPGANNFITDSLGMRLLPVTAGADPEMQFLHADDFADALQAVLERSPGGVFNLAGRGTIRWREAIRLAGSRPVPVPTGLLGGLMDLTWRARLQRRSPSPGLALTRYPWLADISKAGRLLAWQPRHSSRRVVEMWKGHRG